MRADLRQSDRAVLFIGCPIMNKQIFASLFCLPLAVSVSARADDTSGSPTIKISGYGTAALTATNSDQAEFARPNQKAGVGKDPRTGVDSNLGLQANIGINAWLSGTVQGLVRKDGEDNFGAELAWAFAKFKMSDDFSFRLGRVGLPAYMISDYRNVGYANTMLRPPGEVYSEVPLNSVDGADATWQHAFGDTTLTAQLAMGQTKVALPAATTDTVHIEAKDILAINIAAEHGPLTLRVGRVDTKLTLADSADSNRLIAALRATGTGYRMPQLGVLADSIEVKNKHDSFSSVGLGMDWNNVVVQSEYAVRKARKTTAIPDTTAWYVMTGYRIGKFLPYYSHGDLRIADRIVNNVPAGCPVGYPAACTPTLRALSAGVNSLIQNYSPSTGQSSNSIGMRWDFSGAAAFKVQVDRIKPKDGGIGLLPHAQPGFKGPITVGAVAIDFVF